MNELSLYILRSGAEFAGGGREGHSHCRFVSAGSRPNRYRDRGRRLRYGRSASCACGQSLCHHAGNTLGWTGHSHGAANVRNVRRHPCTGKPRGRGHEGHNVRPRFPYRPSAHGQLGRYPVRSDCRIRRNDRFLLSLRVRCASVRAFHRRNSQDAGKRRAAEHARGAWLDSRFSKGRNRGDGSIKPSINRGGVGIHEVHC